MRLTRLSAVMVVLAAGLFLPTSSAGSIPAAYDPFGSWSAFVDQQYQDLLGVAPTAAQRTAAITALTNQTQTPGGLIAGLRASADHATNVNPTTRLYRAFFLRIPDKGGLTYWIGQRRAGTSLSRIADGFAGSKEFKARYGALSNRNFVKLIYDNVLERPYDTAGLNFWTSQLDSHKRTRGTVMVGFSESKEYKAKQASEVTVSVLSILMLSRTPTTSEFNTAVAALDGGKTVAAYATQLLASATYAARVTAPLQIVPPILPTLYAGVPMEGGLDATGGFGDRTWSATGLPAWLHLDPATGTLSGTPPTAGTVTPTVKVTAGAGLTASKAVSLTIKAGMPAGCVTTDCAQLDAATGTIQIPAASVTGVTRNASSIATAVALSASAPAVAVGKILVIAPGTHTPSGLIVKATSVTGANGAARTVAVTASTLTDAYANGIVKATGTPEPAAAPANAAEAAGCKGNASIDITPEATADLKPNVTLLWGKNVAGFGDVFVGSDGVKLFQFQLEGDLTFRLKGSITGSVNCTLDVPGVTVPISVGPAGFLFFKLQPNLGLNAAAGIQIDTTVKVHCSILYRYDPSGQTRSQYCQPTYTPPKVSTASTGADLTISGGITASLTFNEAIGISGSLTASLHAGYHPLAKPIGILDGKVTAKLTACLACAFGSNAPTLTIMDKTLWEKTFATWDTPSPPPTFPLAIATTELPPGTVGKSYLTAFKATGGKPPFIWSATGLPPTVVLNAETGTLSGTVASAGRYNLQVTVADSGNASASRSLPLIVYWSATSATRVAIPLREGGFNSSDGWPTVSGDGRYVGFQSQNNDLVPGDINSSETDDSFLYDLESSKFELVSVGQGGQPADNDSNSPLLSDGGRFAVFGSVASNLVSGDTNSEPDVFIRDRLLGQTTRVPIQGPDGWLFRGAWPLAMSSDGRFIVISVQWFDNASFLLLHDRTLGTSTLIDSGEAHEADISADGRYIAFATTNAPVPDDTNGEIDIYRYDRQNGSIARVSLSFDGQQAYDDSRDPSISADGTRVAFTSDADNLVPDDTNFTPDVFLRDMTNGTTKAVSTSTDGTTASSYSGQATITDDGRHVIFGSIAGNIVPGDTNARSDLFRHDVATRQNTLVTITSDGRPANESSFDNAASGDAQVLAFTSAATNLAPGSVAQNLIIFSWG